MSTSIGPRGTTSERSTDGTFTRTPVRRSTETKAAFKTTEFIAYLGILAAMLISALVVDDAGESAFSAQEVWLYSTVLTVGYMISRGLAKSGSRDPYTDDNH